MSFRMLLLFTCSLLLFVGCVSKEPSPKQFIDIVNYPQDVTALARTLNSQEIDSYYLFPFSTQ